MRARTHARTGIYHVWHQCCQNHWDHVISKDLIHWQRLPPPIQPVTTKTWDGSISMLPADDGGPIILYDAQDGKLGEFGNVSLFFFNPSEHADGERRRPGPIRRYLTMRLVEAFPTLTPDPPVAPRCPPSACSGEKKG